MTRNDDILDQWWNALSKEEQSQAVEADRQGTVPPQLQRSLINTGMFGAKPAEKPVKVPKELHDFLKMRH